MKWFRMEVASSDPSVAEIHIVDIIGDWVDDMINQFWGVDITLTAKAFIKQLAELPASVKTIRVHINSPGGDCFAALTIANALRDQQLSKGRTVETFVDGLAASAASIIMMAGSTVTVADNALVMIHNPWTIAMGAAKDMRKAADDLDKVRTAIVATYKWHSELSDEEIIALLDAETWMDADEAVANGFATAKTEGLKAAALIDRRATKTLAVPEKYRARVDGWLKPEASKPQPAPAVEVLKACTAAGCLEIAQGLVESGATLETVQAKVAETKAAKVATAQRADAITAVCAEAKQPELAAGYIAGGMTVEAVKGHLTTITAKLDKVEIDTGLRPESNTKSKPRIDPAAVYAAMNKGASA